MNTTPTTGRLSSNKCQALDIRITIDQLPEQILWEIFKYLEYRTILIIIRDVCKKLRQTVDNYMETNGIFMINGANDDTFAIIKNRSKTQDKVTYSVQSLNR